ncbi:MAG: type II secretion system F family protein [Verrucomicrobiae bacterium]|nr:type II secretion system F family protein [Verrucomicrobiae bacterium]
METIIILLGLLTGISVASLVFYLGHLSLQVQYVVLADGRRQARSLPVLIRLVLPLANLFPDILRGPGAERFLARFDRKIVSAGFEGLISGRELFLIRFWMGGVALILGIMCTHSANLRILLGVLMVTWLFFQYPVIWISGAVAARHKIIQRGMPIVLDLLTLCVEAGLDFMSALGKIIEKRPNDALNEEIGRVFHSIRLGRTRRQALRELADRVDLQDLTVVVNALVQADELGVSLGSILRIQSDQLRSRRFQRAETMANQAPVKMLLPLVLIFIAAFIVLLGPPLLQMLGSSGGGRGP